jgi:hypothetical protein
MYQGNGGESEEIILTSTAKLQFRAGKSFLSFFCYRKMHCDAKYGFNNDSLLNGEILYCRTLSRRKSANVGAIFQNLENRFKI